MKSQNTSLTPFEAQEKKKNLYEQIQIFFGFAALLPLGAVLFTNGMFSYETSFGTGLYIPYLYWSWALISIGVTSLTVLFSYLIGYKKRFLYGKETKASFIYSFMVVPVFIAVVYPRRLLDENDLIPILAFFAIFQLMACVTMIDAFDKIEQVDHHSE